MRIIARAKINWTLDIVGKRADGYHLMDMLMQPVELADELTLTPADQITLRTTGWPQVEADESNLALRAARLLQAETGYRGGAELLLTKRIPMGAGMGGGSADAAGALAGLNRLWQTGLSDRELETLGLRLGADVPFCLRGGLQRTRGVGEDMTPLPCGGVHWLTVLQPCPGLSTREVFSRFQLDAREGCPDTQGAAAALAVGNSRELCHCLGNVLQGVSEALRPEIGQGIAALLRAGALGAWMTGSGSAVFGLFEGERQARAAAQQLQQTWRACFATRTCGDSLVLLDECTSA